jgi:hypothetical protein
MRSSRAACGASARLAAVASPARTVGARWMGAMGLDHAFALASTLVSVDVVAERFVGSVAGTDLSAEIGVRRQWSPRIVIDAGVARHFSGVLRSNALTLGVGYERPAFTGRRAR